LANVLPLVDALTGFVFKQVYQIVHEDGVQKDFLFGLARELHEQQEVAVLGTGTKGTLPLVVRDKGSPYRAFLYGEIGTGSDEGKYKLLLLLSDQELKRPAAACDGGGIMIDTGRLLPKCGNYKMALSGAITDRTLLEIATQFETQVSRKMTALTPDQLEKRFTTTEHVLETTKYDGEGVFISFDKTSGIFAFNAPSGRVRVGLPALEALEKHLKSQGIQRGLFRAELYLPHTDPKKKRPNVADVLRVSSGNAIEEVATLKFVMLDVIMLDGKDLRRNQEKFTETWELLAKLFGTDSKTHFHRAIGSIVPENELPRVFQERIASGEEGLVVRRLQRLEISKIKPHVSVDAVVIGYVEGEFEGKYGVTSLLTALSYSERKDGKLMLQAFCRVGSGLQINSERNCSGTLSAQKVEVPTRHDRFRWTNRALRHPIAYRRDSR
jgi:hypothetical protein